MRIVHIWTSICLQFICGKECDEATLLKVDAESMSSDCVLGNGRRKLGDETTLFVSSLCSTSVT